MKDLFRDTLKEVCSIAEQGPNLVTIGITPNYPETGYGYIKYRPDASFGKGYKVERQVYLPMFWDDVPLDQTYRMDLVINDNIIVELKAVNFVDKSHRRQLFNYMHLTHTEYGMLINFGGDSLFSEWYRRSPMTGEIDKIKLL